VGHENEVHLAARAYRARGETGQHVGDRNAASEAADNAKCGNVNESFFLSSPWQESLVGGLQERGWRAPLLLEGHLLHRAEDGGIRAKAAGEMMIDQ